jgi:putative ABC transport system substrate-binding protein
MDRREFIGTLAGGLLAAPVVAGAQSPDKIARLGIINSGVNPRSASFFQAFEERLRDLGWVDGKNLRVEFRVPKDPSDFAVIAAEFVRLNVDVILAGGPEPSLKAAREATTTIPIVIVALNYDPLTKGYIASLAHPGGNVTGVFSRSPEQGAKQLELLKATVPSVRVVGILWEAFAIDQLSMIDASAAPLHMRLEKVEVRPPYDYERALLSLKRRSAGAILVVGSPVFFRDRERIAELALKHHLPACGGAGGADAGLLMSFGVDPSVSYRRAADYVDRILRGTKPADLPVEQATQHRLVINLKTAKALGLTIPSSLLLRADEIIQ